MAKHKLNFKQRLAKIQKKSNSLLCVGLDSNVERLLAKFKKEKYPQFEFNKWIIDQTHDHVSAYKPNLAFYESRGSAGWQELEMTMAYLANNYPDIVTIADAKRADIGSTNDGYVSAILDHLDFDALTLHPYLGREALAPFLDRKDKGCIILCRTSNPGAGELQDLVVKGKGFFDFAQNDRLTGRDDSRVVGNNSQGSPLWQVVANKVVNEWNKNENCLMVVGATYPDELRTIRQIAGEMDFLIPGIGAQGGDLQAVMKVGLNSQKRGMIINSSRGIIFAKDPGAEAEKLKDQINKYR